MPKPLRFLSPIHKASREVGVYFERLMANSGLAPQEGHILSYLRSYAPCPIAEVITVFGLRGSTATSVLDRLEERKLLARRPNPDDRRSFLLDLTPEGRQVAEQVQTFVDALERKIAKRITAKDEQGFHAVMEAIHEVTQVTLVERGKG
ncbi:MAG TPA: MarR family transcriptional regulator [Thermoanaerobaculia bacterium]|nr:MarR family transcriptional regulator [Thermoanaerobaculia bacterium]